MDRGYAARCGGMLRLVYFIPKGCALSLNEPWGIARRLNYRRRIFRTLAARESRLSATGKAQPYRLGERQGRRSRSRWSSVFAVDLLQTWLRRET